MKAPREPDAGLGRACDCRGGVGGVSSPMTGGGGGSCTWEELGVVLYVAGILLGTEALSQEGWPS